MVQPPHSQPWMVAFVSDVPSDVLAQRQVCTGTLIDGSKVLTAASCDVRYLSRGLNNIGKNTVHLTPIFQVVNWTRNHSSRMPPCRLSTIRVLVQCSWGEYGLNVTKESNYERNSSHVVSKFFGATIIFGYNQFIAKMRSIHCHYRSN